MFVYKVVNQYSEDIFELNWLCIVFSVLLHFMYDIFRFDDAAEMLKKEVGFHLVIGNTRAVGRLVVAEVLVHLTREDFVAADKAFKEGYK